MKWAAFNFAIAALLLKPDGSMGLFASFFFVCCTVSGAACLEEWLDRRAGKQ